jgi:hypothetical protein
LNVDALVNLYTSGKYDSVVRFSADLPADGRSHERAFRVAGLSLIRLGRYAEARRKIETAMALCPRTAVIRSWLPREMLQSLLADAPDFGWATYQLAIVAFENREFDAAVTLASALADDDAAPIRSAAVELLCELHRRRLPRRDAVGEIARTLDRASAHVGAPTAALFRGIIAYESDDLDGAEAAFAVVAADTTTGLADRIKAAQGAATFRTRLHNPSAAQALYFGRRTRQSMEDLAEVRGDDRVVVLCAADGRYFALFAQSFVASVLHRCGDTIIHVHIVNPTPESAATLEGIRRQVTWARISTSTEIVDFAAPRPYYATARFLIAPEILAAYRLPVISADIDAVFVKSPRAGLDQLAGADVGVKFNPVDRLEYPWTKVFATYAYFAPFAGAFEYLSEVGRYFWDNYDPSGKKGCWWIDQNALLYAAVAAKAGRVRVRDLGRTAVDKIVEANQPMEQKQEFIRRVSARYPLQDLQKRRAVS